LAPHDEAFIDSDGQRLRSWIPRGNLRAVLILVHELDSRGSYYDRFAASMAAHGIASHALDLHGVRRFADLVDGIDRLVGAQRLREPGLPLFLMGHGMGGLAAGLHALAHPRKLAGLVCDSIDLDLPTPALVLGIVRGLAAIVPRLSVLEVFHSRNRFRASLAQLSVPLLVLHGSADTVTLPSGSEYLHKHAGSHDKTLQIFEGYYHDLISDLGHEHVIERIRQWIEARLDPDHRGQIGIAYINTDS
jgi:acylglycerol lipase